MGVVSIAFAVSIGSRACFFLPAGFFAVCFLALIAVRLTFDFAFLDVACFAASLRAGLAFALPRFELFFRAATRFFALAIAISLDIPEVWCALSATDSPL
jgi:hypothetical protein